MCNIVVAMTRRQRHRDSLDFRNNLIPADCVKDPVKLLLGARIIGDQLASIRAQHHASCQQGVAAGIGMKDPPVRIDKKETGSNPVERIAEQAASACRDRPDC
jgi:hypothetical protein